MVSAGAFAGWTGGGGADEGVGTKGLQWRQRYRGEGERVGVEDIDGMRNDGADGPVEHWKNSATEGDVG